MFLSFFDLLVEFVSLRLIRFNIHLTEFYSNFSLDRSIMAWLHDLILFLCISMISSAIRMSQPKILLPFHPRIETNFTLEATDGCFLWSSSRSDLVRIEPLGPFQIKNGENCSLHANIIAHTKQPLRASATVYARDLLTGQSVRCDVIIDKIQTIEIVYTTTRLYLEDAPELFKLRAHDQHGSTFSSIEHFSYEWHLLNAAIVDELSTRKYSASIANEHVDFLGTKKTLSSGTLDATKVIRILRLTDSSYEMSETVRNLESHGSLSYEILLEGLRTGSAFVQAELIDHDLYHNIRAKSVRLSVSANVQFHPSNDVYLLPYSRLPFRLHQIKRQESTDITDLPSTRLLYQVHLLTDDAGTLDEQTLIFTATDHADEQSRLELVDRNMKAIDNDTYESSSLMIRIVNIGYLSAATNSTRPWIYQLGAYYLVTVELFDVNGRKIYPTDNLDLSALIPNEMHRTCLTLTSLYSNGTQYVLRPNCPGRFELEFHLNGMKDRDVGDIPLTATTKQGFEVYLPLSAQPKQVILPEKSSINHQTSTKSSCPIEVLGGSGDYIYTSRDTTVVIVSQHGDLTSQHHINSTTIDIFDRKSPELYTNVSVNVVQPDEFHLSPCPVEIDLHSLLYVPVQLFYKKQALTCCSHVDFDVNIDQTIFEYQGLIPSLKHVNDQSCALLVFKPLKTSLAHLRIQLKQTHLQQSIVLSAFENLTINRHHLLLAVNARYTLQLSHGPLTFHEHEQLVNSISPTNRHVRFEQADANNVRIQCLHEQEQTRFNIERKNSPSKHNRCPTSSTVAIDVTCQSTIDSLAFQPIVSSCPLMSNDYIVSYYDRVLVIDLIAYDQQQMTFDNFTSLKVDCSIKSNDDLADVRLTDRLEITPKHRTGRILLRCSIDKIHQQIEIEFLAPIQLNSSLNLIYINETSSSMNIEGGSGHFQYRLDDLSSHSLMNLSLDENNSRRINIKPMNFGRTTLTIVDRCLPLFNQKLDLLIANIDRLSIVGRSRLEYNTSSLIYLQALDAEGNRFNLTSLYSLMNILFEQSQQPDILAIKYEAQSNVDHQTLAYRIQTLHIGRTYVRFQTIQDKSITVEFEVYRTLRIEPEQLTVLPQSTIQLLVHDGSQISPTTTNIEWSTNDTSIIDIQTNNVFRTKQIGYALIRAKSIGIDPLLGQVRRTTQC
jgi:nuclear pore complex protein Nup210